MIREQIVLEQDGGGIYLKSHIISVTVNIRLPAQIFKRQIATANGGVAVGMDYRHIARYVAERQCVLDDLAHVVPHGALDVIVARKACARTRQSRRHVGRIDQLVVSLTRDRLAVRSECDGLVRARVLIVEGRGRIDVDPFARSVVDDDLGTLRAVIYIFPVVVRHRGADERDLDGSDVALSRRHVADEIVVRALVRAFNDRNDVVSRAVESKRRSACERDVYIRARVDRSVLQPEHVAAAAYRRITRIVCEPGRRRVRVRTTVKFLGRRSEPDLFGQNEITDLVAVCIDKRNGHVVEHVVAQRTVEVGDLKVDIVFARVFSRDLGVAVLGGSVHSARSERVFVGLYLVAVLGDYPEVGRIERERYRAVAVEYLAEVSRRYDVSDVGRLYLVFRDRKLADIHARRLGAVLVESEVLAVDYVEVDAVSAVVLDAAFVYCATRRQERDRESDVLACPVTLHCQFRLVGGERKLRLQYG